MIQCCLLVQVDLAQRSLRRYCFDEQNPCPSGGYHNVSVVIEEAVPFESPWNGSGDDSWSHSDTRWPTACGCGYEFRPEDKWQHNLERLYRHSDGTLYTARNAPAGSMCFGIGCGPTSAEALARGVISSWSTEEGPQGVDSSHLSVKLPDGVWWDMDGPASTDRREGGSGWTREGTPPNVTARPSIQTGSYHGWLTNGQLEQI